MLPKKNRAETKIIDKIFKEGKFLNSPHLTFRFILTSSSMVPRISFIASKSVAKLAVKRNLLRRRGYSVLKKHTNQLSPGLVGAFVFKKYQDDVSILENEIKDIFNKIS